MMIFLLSIEKPARYIGGEVNAVMKEKELEAGEIAYALPCAFPMSMRSECRTSVFRSYMICSTTERMYGERLFTMDGSRQDCEGAGISLFLRCQSQDPRLSISGDARSV